MTPLAAREPYREAAAASLITVTFSISDGFSVLIILVLELFIYAASGPPELILPEVTGTPSMTNKGSCEALNDPIPLMRILWLAPG